MVILKFGGTSVSSAKRVLTICNIVQKETSRKPVLVVSALSGVTDLLLALISSRNDQALKIIEQIRAHHWELINELFTNPKMRNQALFYVNKKNEELKDLVFRGNRNN